ncbi:NADH-quinone oxidoreductase subunit NuoE [Phosphitispora fastidiosa]|uniref:NADH-quinone oxidoreductase subunit NuoE n=1 Tax=Phosphitispora fastidiosa TaxID=2837202 RepID=UPI001E4961D7|nr:NADH-quinone oxidoreductase subunit NuoE [Phosphitispora fastidiosa]MBU7008616.1 NADH-quinone oxidoreductase subunit E [Phosphitispora fastidiosa]
MCQCNCEEPKSNEALELEKVYVKYEGKKGALIPVLQAAQDIYGYLPAEVLKDISARLRIPVSKIYGVVTFYAQFHLNPRGRNIVRVCLGTACHVRGGAKIAEAVTKAIGIKDGETTEDLRYTFESVACLGACGLAPVMMVNDETHGRLTPDKIAALLEKYE